MTDPSSWHVQGEGGVFTPMTQAGLRAYLDLDQSFLGTENYLGAAYYWASDYKHTMREATPYRRRLVHKHLCAAGLELNGVSPRHEAIIARYAGPTQ